MSESGPEIKNIKIAGRHHARQAALQALYQFDTLSEWTIDSSFKEKLDLFFKNFYDSTPVSEKSENDLSFAVFLTEGIVNNHSEIDKLITANSKNWSLSRMNRIDRNILRIGVFEISNCPDTPHAIIINEAIELAKSFGSEDSLDFINGVLNGVAKQQA